ncbi:MAG: glycine zipper 2TM domain-containing protein [Caulobacteraceae bacterium]|nr:glycine zipper 2TM domain-containing protein [Caulobacteraceae bacterium]
MNKLAHIATAGAISLALAIPAAASAGEKTRNAVVGGVLGAVAGAAISDGDTGATVAGGALGALVGVAIAKDGKKHRYYRDRHGRTYYRDSRGRHVYDDYNYARRHRHEGHRYR